MVSCRYVGSDCALIGDREFEAVGQQATFSEQGFREAVLGNAVFITEEDFKKVGFTEEELATHGPSGLRIDPPQGFCDKLALAQSFYFDIRARMQSETAVALAESQGMDVQEQELAAQS